MVKLIIILYISSKAPEIKPLGEFPEWTQCTERILSTMLQWESWLERDKMNRTFTVRCETPR
jgi:hypothetical protein